MNKRIICGVLIATLGLTMLTSCGAKTEEDVFSQKIEGEITVSCYDAMTYKSYLEQAAKKFEEKYPGTKVTVDVAGSMPEIKTQESDGKTMAIIQSEDNQQARDDYISRINTEMMSGKGADVVALDILPYYKYADNGQLVDLSEYMKQDGEFNKSDYAENIIEGAKYKGGQFLFPLDYKFDYFAYDSSLIGDFPIKDKLTYDDVINAVKDKAKETGNKIFPLASYSENGTNLALELFLQNYEKFVDVANKKVNFTDGEFANLLETVKTYADEGYISGTSVTDPSTVTSVGEINMDEFQQFQQEKYYAKSNNNFSLINQFTRNLGEGNYMVSSADGGGDTSDDEIAGLVANDQGEVQFSYTMGFGINNNSQKKRTAWEFLKFLVSEEMQSSGLTRLDAIPININAREQLAAMNITGEAMGAMAIVLGDAQTEFEKPTSKELTPEQETALGQYLQQLNKFTKQLDKYVVQDEKINNMVQDEAKNFFTGQKTADEVANALQSKVSLYLNE